MRETDKALPAGPATPMLARLRTRLGIFTAALALAALALAPSALAVPFHPRDEARDITGLNHACGAAVDSKGDVYLSSAGSSEVKVYDPSHALLTSIPDVHQPCGLAVTTTGNLYVSERGTGEVVRFKPNAYPFAGTPTYGEREVIDASGEAKGISVDPFDNRLYVAEVSRVSVYGSEGNLDTFNEVQNVSVTGATGGTFTLEFEGKKTAAVAFNASAEELKTALEALSTIGAGNVEVTKPSQFSIAFTGKLAHTDVSTLIADASGLTGSGGQAVAVSESSKGFSGHIGEGTLTEASGVAAYTYRAANSGTDRYLWVADAAGLGADRLYLFGGADFKALKLHRKLEGTSTPDGSFGFGAAGTYLAADPGNREAAGDKCVEQLGKQACTAGHLFLYDAAHKALDEFDASGEYLDQARNAAFADAEPTAIAIDRSGGAGDGTIYVTAGAGAGAKALAFGPLKAPSRKTLGEPISKILAAVTSVATDSHGYVYATQGSLIHVYKPDGAEIKTAGKALIEDKEKAGDLAVDSTGKVYVLDESKGFAKEFKVTYYTPSAYPPVEGTTYTRHEPAVATPSSFPVPESTILKGIAVNPGPGPGKDHLFVTDLAVTQEYDSAANGSGLLDKEFAKGLSLGNRQSVAVYGQNGNVYFGSNASVPLIAVVSSDGKEVLARINEAGGPKGIGGFNPFVAVDSANGHVVEYDGARSTAREYDAAGSFVAEFGNFTEGLTKDYRVAVDSSCAIHEPPLTGSACEAYDPANGNVYVAFDDTNASHPPYDVTAFGPLEYPPTPTPPHKLTVKREGTGSGTVTSSPAGINCGGGTCSAEFEETKVVTLTATPKPGSEFVKWTGCEAETSSPAEGTCEVTMSKDREVVAEFRGEAPSSLTIKKLGVGKGTVTSEPLGIDCGSECSEETAEFGGEVILTATADKGSEFVKWTGCEDEPSKTKCAVDLTEAKEVQVEFGVEHPLLTVKKEGAGSGTVTSEPPGINCGGACSAKFDLNKEVTLTAEPDEGSVFVGWEGCDAEPSETECEVTMEEPREVKAIFAALPQVIARHPLPVLYDEATLRGEVDPSGLPTEYRFEYLTEDEYEANGETFEGAQGTPMVELTAAKGFVPVSSPLLGLQEGTEYRFRLRAQNSVGPVEDEGAFETLQRRVSPPCANAAYRTGFSANLPDCRAYELVTPANTNGAGVFAPIGASFNNWLTPPRDTGRGEAFSFETGTTLPGFEGSGVIDGYRSERGVGAHPGGGWDVELVSPSYVQGGGTAEGALAGGISPDQLFSFWHVDPIYSFEGGLPQGTYLRTPVGFEAAARGSLGNDLAARSQFVSAGGVHVIFSSKAQLEGKAAPNGTEAIYDRKAGEASAEVVSVKPDGSSFGAGEGATYIAATEDGSAVVFSVGGVLYVHRNGATVEIATGGNTFNGVSSDGTHVFYMDKVFNFHNPTPPAGLFACKVEEGNCAGPEQDQEPTEIAEESVMVIVSSDGSHAFFTSTEALTGGEENENNEHAEAGEHNLYAWDGVGTHFIAVLDPQDLTEFEGNPALNLGVWTKAITAGVDSGLAYSAARSTPNGEVFVFQSHAPLSAYENEGVGEIYRYAPGAPSGERLTCVSCDPTGVPPGDDAVLGIPPFAAGAEKKSASGIAKKTVIPNVTDDGSAVFFQSPDRLLPEDANEVEDVYEWRAKGSGDPECTRPGGCLALISSGQGEVPSFLYAMSADGHDVFFRTQEKLVGLDIAGSPSIYDAREEGGIPEPEVREPCQGDACQGQGSEPPVLPSPATTGGGEVGEAPPPLRPCAKGKHRVKGRCVPAKHHKHRRHRRAHANRGGNR